MLYTDEGFVIRKHEMLNEDQVVYFFLEKHGKVACIAKGIKKPTSRKAGNLDLFNYCRVSLAKGKNLDIITEVKVIEDYSILKQDQGTAFFLFYLDELTMSLVYESEESIDIFKLVKQTLTYINSNADALIMQICIYVNCRMLVSSGVFPELSKCAVCSLDINEKDKVVFQKAGVAHEGCISGIPLSIEEIKVLRYARDVSIEKFMALNIPLSIQNKLFSLTTGLIEYTIGTLLRSKIYIHGSEKGKR